MKTMTIACIGVGLLAGPASAGLGTIDQNQPSDNTLMAGFGQVDLAQSFQTQTANNISGAGLYMDDAISGSDTLTIELWDALPNNAGTMLGSGSVVANSDSWADVDFGAPIPISQNTTYFLVFYTANNGLGIAGDTNDPYAFGNVFANAGYQPFPTFDYTFRTYTLIPAPGAFALLGIAGFATSRRRRG